MKNKNTIMKILFVIINILIYFYLVFYERNQYIYGMSYLKCVLFMLLTSLCIYVFGLIENKEKSYKENIIIYIILFLILLTSFTFVIARVDLHFYTWFFPGQYHPFHTIMRQFQIASLKTFLKNIIGNMFMLIPLSFLLMLKDNKYKGILKQTLIALPIIILIEVLQGFTHTGVFDIDDIILNYLGVVIFTILLGKTKLVDKIKPIFYKDFKLKKKTKYIVLSISLILLIIFVISTLLKI